MDFIFLISKISFLCLWFCFRRSAEVVGTRKSVSLRCRSCSIGYHVRNLICTFKHVHFHPVSISSSAEFTSYFYTHKAACVGILWSFFLSVISNHCSCALSTLSTEYNEPVTICWILAVQGLAVLTLNNQNCKTAL